MSPQLFEALVFLRVNESFWYPELVGEAINGARSERAAMRLRNHEFHEIILCD